MSLRILPTADIAVIATARVAFALRHLGTGLYPDAMESWSHGPTITSGSGGRLRASS
ncbi:hypothetical protein RKD29_001175 [Streptomyces tendae]|uniref:hypothetical protein n=1 Tax=Streptomyces tendae TaxID=1932 RepID=UPI0038355B6F